MKKEGIWRREKKNAYLTEYLFEWTNEQTNEQTNDLNEKWKTKNQQGKVKSTGMMTGVFHFTDGEQ